MVMRKSLILMLVLAGCVAPMGAATPDRARLSATVLTLVLTDGTVCRANWKGAPVGRFDRCGPGFGYAVQEVSNPNILRQFWTGITTALGAEGAVPPMAHVVITDAAGLDHVFVSPVTLEG
jgi:hypothetical protein